MDNVPQMAHINSDVPMDLNGIGSINQAVNVAVYIDVDSVEGRFYTEFNVWNEETRARFQCAFKEDAYQNRTIRKMRWVAQKIH